MSRVATVTRYKYPESLQRAARSRHRCDGRRRVFNSPQTRPWPRGIASPSARKVTGRPRATCCIAGRYWGRSQAVRKGNRMISRLRCAARA
jgi:hypothetical protein